MGINELIIKVGSQIRVGEKNCWRLACVNNSFIDLNLKPCEEDSQDLMDDISSAGEHL